VQVKRFHVLLPLKPLAAIFGAITTGAGGIRQRLDP
jgi:hypothetical protein